MPESHKHNLTARQERIFSDYRQRRQKPVRAVESSIGRIDSANSLYKALNGSDEIKAKAFLMLVLRDWLTNVSCFDPVSGDALCTGMIDLLDAAAKWAREETSGSQPKDRIYRIVSHAKEAVLAIMTHARDKILREYAMLPIYAAREVDSNSIRWLSHQQGRNLREKLSGKPYIKAVARRHSVDTAENRLFKAFLFMLEQILVERQNALPASTEDVCEELLVFIQRWCRSESASEIGVWENLLPNNPLLHDKHYRKVWDSWLWIRGIDALVSRDSKRVHRDLLSVIYWNTLSLLNQSGRFRIAQQPVRLDYDNFSISPQLPVRGYLFPRLRGKIKHIQPEKKFGFIASDGGEELYCHQRNLFQLKMDALSAGDEVSFVMGNNKMGVCADKIVFATEVPVSFCLSDDKWEIQLEFGDEKYFLQIIRDELVIRQDQDKKAQAKIKIAPENLRDIPKIVLSLVTGERFEYEPTGDQAAPTHFDSAVVDLCSIRPAFMGDAQLQKFLSCRLLLQYWPVDDDEVRIDCGYARAIILEPNARTVSMRSLFSDGAMLPEATKSDAAMFFAQKLRDGIHAKRLTYLVPDRVNEFDLERIRKSINFYFDESTPLPKSIAAVFAWQASDMFVNNGVCDNDYVLVTDLFDGGISITPVQAIYSRELKEALPETQGIRWERYPAVIVPDTNIHTAIADNLEHDGCPEAQEIIRLFGFDGLSDGAGEISFEKDGRWYHLPRLITPLLEKLLFSGLYLNKLPKDIIDNCKKSIHLFILPLDEVITKPPRQYQWPGTVWLQVKDSRALTKGGQILNRWQQKVEKEVNDITLWRDHLPELSIQVVDDGRFEDFYLVKNATVTPRRGRAVCIPVKKQFKLHAGRTHYSFPLQQGEGNKKLQFVAYLKSPAFPLNKTTSCRLDMTYTYGADDPYELRFIPLDPAEAGFKSIRVDWRPVSKETATVPENLLAPDFPPRKSWADLQNFPKDGNFSNLLDRCCSAMRDLEDFAVAWKERKAGRFERRGTDRNGKDYCFVEVEGRLVFCHSSNFTETDFGALNKGDLIDLNVCEGEKGFFGISSSDYYRKRISRLRFPVLNIWNYGRSLEDPDVPGDFREKMSKGIERGISVMQSENMPTSLKEELFFFLCCLHKDAPEMVRNRLCEVVKDKEELRNNLRNVAFAIGDAGQPYQQALWKNVLAFVNDSDVFFRSYSMRILAIALWRSAVLINKLSKDVLKTLTHGLYDHLDWVIKNIKSSPEEIEARKKWPIGQLTRYLELLLALLRSRKSEREDLRRILAPGEEMAEKYVKLIDDISKTVIDNHIELKSRIDLKIDKPETFSKTPDLLYALRMYLTGDSGANAISIAGVSDE